MIEFSAWHWFILACAFLIIEILAPLAFFLWLAGAALLIAVVSLLFPELSWQTEWTLFAISCLASIVGWAIYRPKTPQNSEQPNLSQRNEQYLNHTVVVCEEIKQGSGKVKVNDSIWKALGPDAKVGTKMTVKRVDGSIFHVE